MSISKTISEVAGVLEATRLKLSEVASQISVLEQKRFTIVTAKPHTDDIAEACRRGLAVHVRSFEQHLIARLTKTFVSGDGAAAAVEPQRSTDILRAELDAVALDGLSMKGKEVPLRPDAIVYFMRDAIAAEIPALITRLIPASATGMKNADRVSALAEIDAELGALRAESEALQNDLGKLRQAVNG